MIELSDLYGKEVLSSNAKLIGVVEDVALDLANWKVPAIGIKINKGNELYLNKKKKLVGQQVAMVKVEAVRSISDMVTLNVEMENMGNTVLEDYKAQNTLEDQVGKRVLDKSGREIGTVKDFQIDMESSWSIPMFEVVVDKVLVDELKVKKKIGVKPTIKLRTSDVKNVADVFLLGIDVGGIKDYLSKKPASRVD
ncbi:MAG: PRC-barrel domain-containing protein [Methanomassiliicoccales archaeon]|nr:MAG: PRC-barrel domain-containing protein [Methanomassiliicoccales archaeon]